MNKKTILLLLGGLFALVLIYYLSTNVIPKMLVTASKAAPATKVSISDSYVLASKILARADGIDKCKVNVFLMDEKRKGVAGKRIELEGGGVIEAVDGFVSNKNGMVAFEISSNEAGQFELTAKVEGVPLSNGVKVTFR